MQAQWQPTTTKKGPPIAMIQQLANPKQEISTHYSPPLVLQYDNTDTWSDEGPCTQTPPRNSSVTKQQIQLQTYINAAEKIQWQHQDNTITQEILLEELVPVTNHFEENGHAST